MKVHYSTTVFLTCGPLIQSSPSPSSGPKVLPVFISIILAEVQGNNCPVDPTTKLSFGVKCVIGEVSVKPYPAGKWKV